MQGRDLTDEQLKKFLKRLLTNHGNVSDACKSVKVSRAAVYERKKEDEVFAGLWEDVLESCTEAAESELYRRAVKGTDKPVFYKGELVDTFKEYSDRLLEFYLKARRPEVYRDRVDVNQNVSGGLSLDVTAAIDSVYGEKEEKEDETTEND